MCTALSLRNHGHYFGRTLDLDCSYGEKVCITPRNFPIPLRKLGVMDPHYALIGMAVVMGGMPLYYDAANERGLCMAGLNFPGNACYHPEKPDCDNVTPFEFIPWVLGQCATVAEAKKLLEKLNLVDIPFSAQVPLSPLHWIISDSNESLVVESMADGLHVYRNPTWVMANNPPFPYQLFNLNNYRGLSPATSKNTFGEDLSLDVYCQGLGAIGLPGDCSSMSRFVRAAFYVQHSVCEPEETACVSQFFHALGAVEMPRGGCLTDHGPWDITVYTGCIHAETGRYYYTTYDNHRISCVDLHKADLEGCTLSVFDLKLGQDICCQN